MLIGLSIGLLLPLITSYIIFFVRFGDTLSLFDFIERLIKANGFTKLISISVIPNLLIFMLAINLNRLLAARGIVTATLIYAVTVIVLRFVI
jgi:hypothetical protein